MIEIGDRDIVGERKNDPPGRTIGEIMGGTASGTSTFTAAPIVLGPGTVYMNPPAATLDLDAAKLNIERGVPMPPAKKFDKGSSWLPVFKAMSVGDSIFFAGAKLTQLGYARTVAKKHDFTISIRAVTGGVRVWRVAAPGETDDGLGA